MKMIISKVNFLDLTYHFNFRILDFDLVYCNFFFLKLNCNKFIKMNEDGDKRESLWFQMLESILSTKIDQSANILLLGSSKTGKK